MQPGRLAVVDSDALSALSAEQLQDALDAADPHAIVATAPPARVRLRSTLSDLDRPILTPGAGTDTDRPQRHVFGDVEVVLAPSLSALSALGDMADGDLDPATETYVLSDLLDLSVRPTELRTVRQGLSAYRDALATDDAPRDHSLRGSHTHLSTGLPAGYHGDWDGLTVRGTAPGQIDGASAGGATDGESAVASLALGPDGTVATTQYRRDSLGLRAIDGIGEQRARTLRDVGYATRDDLANAPIATIADLDGIARSTAPRLVERARAFDAGTVRRRTDESLPRPEPIFVDIETDGLSPSIVWLIGVLDREASPGERYRSFLVREPNEPGAALAAFCTWLESAAADRPIVAYNGDSFDVPVLTEQIERHCPEHGEFWAARRTFDPYTWAVREGNAVLPGRTNGLETVASALGFTGADAASAGADIGDDSAASVDATPLDGAEVARIYREWMADPIPENEPDWQTLEAYCEADVRALAFVYDAIDAADRTAGASPAERAGSESASETTQGRLGDF